MRVYGDDRDTLIQKRVHLVQCGRFVDNVDSLDDNNINGIDDIVDLYYMGSAEFQWGSLPRSLRRMTINKDFYKIFTFDEYKDKNGNPLKVYAPRIFFDNVKKIVERLVVCGDGLQEYCSLHRNFEDNNDDNTFFRNNSNFWWDIENDFFIFFEHTDKVIEAMNSLEERKFGTEKDEIKPAFNRLTLRLLTNRGSFVSTEWNSAIKNYHFDENAGVHFIEFKECEELDKILMEAIIIAKVDKGLVFFTINGIHYYIYDETKLEDIVKEKGIKLNEYAFFSGSIEELISQYNEEIQLKRKQYELVNVLYLVKNKQINK